MNFRKPVIILNPKMTVVALSSAAALAGGAIGGFSPLGNGNTNPKVTVAENAISNRIGAQNLELKRIQIKETDASKAQTIKLELRKINITAVENVEKAKWRNLVSKEGSNVPWSLLTATILLMAAFVGMIIAKDMPGKSRIRRRHEAELIRSLRKDLDNWPA